MPDGRRGRAAQNRESNGEPPAALSQDVTMLFQRILIDIQRLEFAATYRKQTVGTRASRHTFDGSVFGPNPAPPPLGHPHRVLTEFAGTA